MSDGISSDMDMVDESEEPNLKLEEASKPEED